MSWKILKNDHRTSVTCHQSCRHASWSFDHATLQSSFPLQTVDWWSDFSGALAAGFSIRRVSQKFCEIVTVMSSTLAPSHPTMIEVDEDAGRWVWEGSLSLSQWTMFVRGTVVIARRNVMVAPFWFAETNTSWTDLIPSWDEVGIVDWAYVRECHSTLDSSDGRYRKAVNKLSIPTLNHFGFNQQAPWVTKEKYIMHVSYYSYHVFKGGNSCHRPLTTGRPPLII